jgi:phosphatidylserine/phosphatidylglycerophosphate/cardiolipin synthase-like enzyme
MERMERLRYFLQGLVCGSVLFFCLLTAVSPALAASHPAQVTLLPNREYGEALLHGIRKARRRVVFTFFLFKSTDSRANRPRQLVEELIEARRRGLAVTVVLEQDRGGKDRLNEENRQTAALLERGGVRVIFDSPRTTTHVKAVVIDDRFVYLGSHNLTESALRHNNELSVLIDSPELAAEVLSYLNRL